MLPYSAVYSNQLQQAAALSYHHQNQRAPSPNTSLQLAAASFNFERLRYGFAAVQSSPNGGAPGGPPGAGGGGVVGPNQAQGGSPVAGGYPPAMFHQAAAAAAAAAAFDPMTLAAAGFRHAGFDPRTGRFLPPEEPKPQHSYIGLIAMAILSVNDKKMVLSDIYQWILDHYPYFRTRGPGWRNSIRHNLSLNDCFIKAGRSANGKGHYWAIHPANVEDFKKGDFRRRRAQRKVRKHMGLSVPDDEDDSDDSPCSSPPNGVGHAALTNGAGFFLATNGLTASGAPPGTAAVLASLPHAAVPTNLATSKIPPGAFLIGGGGGAIGASGPGNVSDEEAKSDKHHHPEPKRRRLFDMESLLASKTDERRDAIENGRRSGSNGLDETPMGGDGINGSEKCGAQPAGLPMAMGPNPFFFPPPLPPHHGSPESVGSNGHFLAAMAAAAAAAGFMPFSAFMPGGSAVPGLPWNFGGPYPPPPPPVSSSGYFWLPPPIASTSANVIHGQQSSSSDVSPSRPGSKAPSFDNHSGNTETTTSDSPTAVIPPPTSDSPPRTPSPQDTAAQWQETFAKIMARSYQGRNQLSSQKSHHHHTSKILNGSVEDVIVDDDDHHHHGSVSSPKR